jgi:hypothetical protein
MREVSALTDKSIWIYNHLEDEIHTADDVYDVLLGNINEPRSFVDAVTALSAEYDREKDRRFQQSSTLDKTSARSGLFSYQY